MARRLLRTAAPEALEEKAAEMRAILVNCKAMFRNRDWTTLLLALIVLHQNRVDDVRGYTRIIRAHLTLLRGRTPRHNRINRSARLHWERCRPP